jgi:hypothetical protein
VLTVHLLCHVSWAIPEMNRIHLFLLGTHSRTSGPYLQATDRNPIQSWVAAPPLGGRHHDVVVPSSCQATPSRLGSPIPERGRHYIRISPSYASGGSVSDHLLGAYKQSLAAICLSQVDPSKCFPDGAAGLVALLRSLPLAKLLGCEDLKLPILRHVSLFALRRLPVSMPSSIWLSSLVTQPSCSM